MENNDLDTTVDTAVETPDPKSQPIAYAENLRSERLKQNSMQPDFNVPNAKSTDMVFKESVMRLTPVEIDDIMRNSGFRESAWKQTGVAIENALIGMNQMSEEMALAVGNLENYLTGGQIGEELQNIAYEALDDRMSQMALNEESVGGIRDFWVKVAGGAVSFTQLALEGVATAGILPLAQIGIQAFGEGTYNDMKKYADEHDGSLKGYRPKGTDVAINTANTIFQVASEAWLGVGSPRFLRGWSRGFAKEAGSGFVQESLQDVVQDFAEIAKGNKGFEDMLNNADQYLIDGVIGAMLQGPLGAVTYSQARRRSDMIIARAHAIAKGRKTPVKEDFDVAKKLNDAKERNYASVLNKEFKAAFDASTGEGQLQQNIASALNKAAESKELDLGVDNETDRAQKIEQIATQETLNAMEMAQEQGKAISEMELNNIVYRDGSIYLEGYEPEIGERAVDRARVIAERQSGLADVQMKLDNLSQEVQQTKKEIAEAKVANQQALVDRLQARLDKQNALLEKRRIQTEKLIEQTEKIQKQIEQRLAKKEKATTKEIKPVEPAEPKTVEPLAKVSEKLQKPQGEPKSLKKIEKLRQNSNAKAQEVITILNNNGFKARQTAKPKFASRESSVYIIIETNPSVFRKFRISFETKAAAKNHKDVEVSYYSMMPANEIANDIIQTLKAPRKEGLIHKGQEYYDENTLKQSKVEGTGSDKYRGGYDERLKRIILGEKSDLTTIQHEFAHYWMQNNFKWARSGLASAEWLSRWRNVEEALGIEPRDRYLSRQASEKFARAYEQYILQDKIDPDLRWAFDGFQKFYAETYEDLENEYFDLSEELDPAIVDWFNRQRPVTEQALKDQQYKKVADVAMAQGVSVITPVSDGNYVVSSMNENGEVQSDVVVTDEQAQGSKLAQYRDKKGKSGVVEGLREATGQDLPASEYNVLNRAETVEQAREWIANDRQGAWDAMTSDKTNIIDRTALFQAFKEEAENGDYELGAELANTKFPSAMTEVGQALSVLGERSEYDPLTILEMQQKALGEPTVEELGQQIQEMNLDAELDADQVKDLEETTECVL